jgi:hypothetical protein
MAVKKKRGGFALEMKTFDGQDGNSSLVFRTGTGSFHVFMEVEAKEAARQCGSTAEKNTRGMWSDIWRGGKV